MEATFEKLNLKNLDKSTWKSFRFDQIAKSVSERVDPKTTQLEIYVGLEHLDAEDIHIRRKGKPQDVEGQKLKCYPGDIIFGKRRAYQRKAAIVDFEGICSAHAFVLRVNPEVIDPKLFPFFLHSDAFMNRAIDISVGGLSPTINWGDLKEQEFLLPPKDQQAQLAELLWALDDVIERDKVVLDKLEQYNFGFLENFICKKLAWINNSSHWSVIKLNEVLSIPEKIKAEQIDRNNLITVKLHRKGVVKNETVEGLKIGATTYFVRRAGQFIYGKQNLHNGALGIVPAELDGYLSSSDIPALNINEELVVPKYLENYLGRESFYKSLEKYSAGSGAKRISEKVIMNIEIDLPPMETQIKFINIFDTIQNSYHSCQSKILSVKSLQKSLINQIF